MKVDKLKVIRDLVETQGADGNWNHDPYMHGMYNGMELLLAFMEDRDPEFKEAPAEWLADKEDNRVPTHSESYYDGIFDKAMKKAGEVLGADPAYFGADGKAEVENQLNMMGYTLEELKKKGGKK